MEKRETILVSACLLGAKVRYDGQVDKARPAQALLDFYDIIPICPEMDGGLPCPRPQSEISGAAVKDVKGHEVTVQFKKGASLACELVRTFGIKLAILKENSPSCGSNFVYDGTFSNKKIEGSGLTATALREVGVQIYTEDNISDLLAKLRRD